MFETLSQGFSNALEKLTKQGVLREDEISTALREVRIALLEADVSLEITKRFVKSVGEKARGQAVTKSVTPGQQVIKIVHDELIKVLEGHGEISNALKIDNPPATILMVGLQGSGKTTTSAKLALRLQNKEKKKVLLASLDTRRPAAMEQLEILGKSNSIDTLPIMKNQSPEQITSRALQQASLGGYDVIILDSAGRMQIDDELMTEIEKIKDLSNPNETLLIADGLTGQEAVNVASAFNQRLDISGVVLTRMDGDGRGGAALSMVSTIGKSIKFIGTGEKVDALEEFHPDRIARRILGMGDIVSLVEKASETLEAEKAERSMRRFQKGLFNMNDLKNQLEQMQKMGGLQSLMGMMPGMGMTNDTYEMPLTRPPAQALLANLWLTEFSPELIEEFQSFEEETMREFSESEKEAYSIADDLIGVDGDEDGMDAYDEAITGHSDEDPDDTPTPEEVDAVSYTHLTLPTNREV